MWTLQTAQGHPNLTDDKTVFECETHLCTKKLFHQVSESICLPLIISTSNHLLPCGHVLYGSSDPRRAIHCPTRFKKFNRDVFLHHKQLANCKAKALVVQWFNVGCANSAWDSGSISPRLPQCQVGDLVRFKIFESKDWSHRRFFGTKTWNIIGASDSDWYILILDA